MKNEVIRWIAAQRDIHNLRLDEIDLIESRTIDSMKFLDFVYLISELCGRDIDKEISIDDLRTIGSIQSFVLTHSTPEKV
ncbi:hypothetical protein K4831_25790 (plasmid) [Agrobacterium vitis]|nr:acyl carrier protein [Agrobacterium vitis]QZO07666.1 hypothetical protein K4831_25790 [Agrobacterium vitis]UJL91005.1 acyl carrier protein [Agrobacterium vitis]